jgi:hypothetical protein
MTINAKTSQAFAFLLVSLLSIFMFACAPKTYRTHPEFEQRVSKITNPGMLPSDVRVYELTAGGVQDLRDDWCKIGKENVQKAVYEALKQRPFKIEQLVVDKEIEEEIEDIQALYRAVSLSIQLHTYNPQFLFPEKVNHFVYSVGPVDKILKKYGADAIIFVYGFDEISTGGRKALQVAGIIVGAFTGVVVGPRAGITAVSVALVDSSGEILWYNLKASVGGKDLRDFDSCASMINDMIGEFPSTKK